MKRFDDDQASDYGRSCMIHIRTAALISTLLTLGYEVYVVYLSLFTDFHGGRIGFFGLLTSVLAIYAYWLRAAWAWLPIIFWNACCCASHLLTAVIFLSLHVASYVDFPLVETALRLPAGLFAPQAFQNWTAVVVVVFALLACLWAWFTMITYHAYKWQKREDTQKASHYVELAV